MEQQSYNENKSEKDEVAKDLAIQSKKYKDIYGGIDSRLTKLSLTTIVPEEPTFSERVSRFFGRGKEVARKIEERQRRKHEEAIGRATREIIEEVLPSLDSLKREAINVLDGLISLSDSSKADVINLKERAVGREVMQSSKRESAKRRVNDMIGSCGDVILFVQGLLTDRNSGDKFPPNDVRWARLDIKNLSQLLDIDVSERVRIYDIWNEFTESLREMERARSAVESAKDRLDNFNFFDNTCQYYLELYREERAVIQERFAALELYLKSREIRSLEGFYKQRIGTRTLNELRDATAEIETEIGERFG
jgi:hypothetical protein